LPVSQSTERYLKAVIFLACLAPLVILLLKVVGVGGLRLGPNPVEDIQDELGIWAIRFMLLTLAMTPLRYAIRKTWPVRFRRMFGLFAFTYAALHFLNYLLLDKQLDFPVIFEDVIDRWFITVGFAALLAMIPLAITSTGRWQRRLGRNWLALHKIVYGVGIAVCWHFFLSVKIDLTEPLIYGGILAVLLIVRIVHKARKARAV